jgi:hypothetical protein
VRRAASRGLKHRVGTYPLPAAYVKVGGSDSSSIGSYWNAKNAAKGFTPSAALTVRRIDADLLNVTATMTGRIGIATSIGSMSDITTVVWATSAHTGAPAYVDYSIPSGSTLLSVVLPDDVVLASGTPYFIVVIGTTSNQNIGAWSSAPAPLNLTWSANINIGTGTSFGSAGADASTPYIRLYQGVTGADNFNRADSGSAIGTASGGGPWTIPTNGGTFGITSNKLYVAVVGSISVGGTGYAMALRNIGAGIHDVTVTINRADTNGWTGICLGMSADGTTGLMVRIDSGAGTVQTSYSTAGTWTNSGNLTMSPSWSAWTGGSSTIRCVYNPATQNLTIYQGGVQKYSASLGATVSGPYAGVAQNGSGTADTFDDFLAIAS